MPKSNKYYEDEARAFIAAHPDYVPNSENRDRLILMLKARQMDLTRDNLAILWREMQSEEIPHG